MKMPVLKEKEWMFLDEMIHMIYDTGNLNEMRYNLLELLSVLIPNSSASFYLANVTDNVDKLLSDPVVFNMSQKDVVDYLDFGEKLDYTIPIYQNARPIAYKETDLFDEGFRENTEFYNEFLAHGLEYPMALCIANNGMCYGALSLFRSKRMGDFSDRDIFILNQLRKHLVTRIHFEYGNKKTYYGNRIDDIKTEYFLTARECEIINFMLEGLNNEEICQRLFIEEGTVKKHVHNIYYKLKVKNRFQLLKMLY